MFLRYKAWEWSLAPGSNRANEDAGKCCHGVGGVSAKYDLDTLHFASTGNSRSCPRPRPKENRDNTQILMPCPPNTILLCRINCFRIYVFRQLICCRSHIYKFTYMKISLADSQAQPSFLPTPALPPWWNWRSST